MIITFFPSLCLNMKVHFQCVLCYFFLFYFFNVLARFTFKIASQPSYILNTLHPFFFKRKKNICLSQRCNFIQTLLNFFWRWGCKTKSLLESMWELTGYSPPWKLKTSIWNTAPCNHNCKSGIIFCYCARTISRLTFLFHSFENWIFDLIKKEQLVPFVDR